MSEHIDAVAEEKEQISKEDFADIMAELQKEHEEIDFDGEIGGDECLLEPDVDIQLHPSRTAPVAGELWSISGEIHNRSDKPIWIIDTLSTVALAPEMYGHASDRGSIGAFFPTIQSRPQHEVVRIDSGASYSIVWKIPPIARSEGKVSNWGLVANALKNYSFFSPGIFKVFSTMHIFSTKPQFNKKGKVSNIGSSFPITVSKDIEMAPSPWVLILGAAIGGLLCFAIQSLTGAIPFGVGVWEVLKATIIGGTTSVLLASVATILISRLATTEFLIMIKVKDIWGAIATGFAIQWLGVSYIANIISSISSGS
ncbi:hypothetical protein [Pseudoalteromonas sp. OANN1]|uniref:hypothetical protein n=1 Tax=Pseudoalteromonas sp. OANN1 TaxID=2954497 RepID=UPI002097E0E0|nr:hypothetical protein [Pseudoalteromonas sp. OANN1]MCO7200475.1 hypothetical protein [Pseudoalteromonas sp. OANN1]